MTWITDAQGVISRCCPIALIMGAIGCGDDPGDGAGGPSQAGEAGNEQGGSSMGAMGGMGGRGGTAGSQAGEAGDAGMDAGGGVEQGGASGSGGSAGAGAGAGGDGGENGGAGAGGDGGDPIGGTGGIAGMGGAGTSGAGTSGGFGGTAGVGAGAAGIGGVGAAGMSGVGGGGASSGAGGSSGSGGTTGGGACNQEGVTRACCREGAQTCVAGTWGPCTGAHVSAESCNEIDDDCDGETDELGTFTCGLGACERTVAACVGGDVAACIPFAPTTTSDGCNGVDDDCDGAIDEDCSACLHVSPTGDDAAAALNNGTSAFASVQVAIDFADAHRNVATRVCVAAGTACGATATFPGPAAADLTMRNGIDVLGSYESTGWTRCTDSVTRLEPQSARGVYFPPGVTTRTALDGFAVSDSLQSGVPPSAIITVEGARGVLLTNLAINGGQGALLQRSSVEITDSEAQISRTTLGSFYGATGISALRSRISVRDNCPGPVDPLTGRCTTTCTRPYLSMNAGDALLLENSPGSHVEANAFCAQGDGTAIRVLGSAEGIVIRGNMMDVMLNPGRSSWEAVHFGPCAGASPWFVGNVLNARYGGSHAVVAMGDCHPVIEANPEITAARLDLHTGLDMTAIRCIADGGVASRCVVTENPNLSVLEGTHDNATSSNFRIDTAVHCEGGSCARIDHNRILGLVSQARTANTRYSRFSSGLIVNGVLNGAPTLVDSNVIDGGCSYVMRFSSTGIRSNYAARIQNNVITAGCSPTEAIALQTYLGPAEVHSNDLAGSVQSSGLNVFRNNIFAKLPTSGQSASVFQNNAISTLLTLAELETLLGPSASGNILACARTADGHLTPGSTCIDAGTPTGAPHFDREGDRRDSLPDIGPDEYVP